MSLLGIVQKIIGMINLILPVLVGVALVLFLWGIVRYIYNVSDVRSKDADREIFVWGLIALFVMVSVWGIIATLCLSFFGDSKCDPLDPSDVDDVSQLNHRGSLDPRVNLWE